MKRCSPRRRYYLARRRHNEFKRTHRKSVRIGPSQRRYFAFPRDQLEVPAKVRVSSNPDRNELLGFLENLRNKVYLERRSVTIDFSRVRRMYVDGTLLLRAEIERLTQLCDPSVSIRCILSRTRKVNEVLQQVGIFPLLKCFPKLSPVAEDVVRWRAAAGANVDGEKTEPVLGPYYGDISEELSSDLYEGVIEAMQNCLDHAYLGCRPDGLNQLERPKQWWMFSQFKDGLLSVAFCDLGIGFSGSLPKTNPPLWQRLVGRSQLSHGRLIEEAIKLGVTGTQLPHRGKGVLSNPDMSLKGGSE